MLKGRLGDTSGAPYIEGRVYFPRLRLRGLVSFLVDTGADGTMFMPADSKKFGIDFRSLRNKDTSEGIGGLAQSFEEDAILSFSDGRYVYSFLIPIHIAAPTVHNHRFPSLLGRDFLKSGNLTMNTRKRRLTFTPYTWSLRQKL